MIFYFILLILFSNIECNKIRGINIGSYFVLEPYINPSLFYQFIGLNNIVVSDSYNFCKYLGPQEANKQLIQHWNTWIDFQKLNTLKSYGINTIRIPIADWMFIPYEVYNISQNNIKCFDNSLLYLDKLFNYCEQLDLNIILDLHAMKDSQNGFDNSGLTKNVITKKINNVLHFDHWNHRSADWIGDYNLESKKYMNINYNNINYSLTVIQEILKKYLHKKSFWALEPVNEPWEFTPLNELKTFYKNVYDIFKSKSKNFNNKVLIFHDSFRPSEWTDAYFLEKDGKPKLKIYLDTHQYMAWGKAIPFNDYIKGAREWEQPYSVFDIIVGEFSLATDNCLMWLNGFMDNQPGFPLQKCFIEDCPYKDKYLNQIKKVEYGPFGSGNSYPTKDGMCPTTIPMYLNENISLMDSWIIKSKNYNIADREKYYATKLFEQLVDSYEKKSSGWIFWNFDVESSTYQWSFLNLINKNYILPIPNDNNENKKNININIDFYQIILLGFLVFLIIMIIKVSNNDLHVMPHYHHLLHSFPNYYEVLNENEVEMNQQNKNYGSINV